MEYYFYKKRTLTVESNKTGKRTFTVKLPFLTEKKNSGGLLTAYFGTETFIVKK